MKNKILSIFVFTLLIASVLGIAISAQEENIHKRIIETIDISEPYIVEEGNFLSINFEEVTSQFMQPGKPILPVYTKIYKFPFGTKINEVVCTPLGISQKTLSGEIKPSPKPVLIDSSVSEESTDDLIFKDVEVYNSAEFFPNKWYDFSTGCGLDDTNRVVFLRIQFYPAIYSPQRNLIKYANSAEISIEYTEPFKPVGFPDEYDMVIIAPSEFSEKLQPFVVYKNDCGIDTLLVTLDDIYDGEYFPVNGRDNPERIKYFIKDAIENWGITYVLLAGGINKVPSRPSYVQDGHEINFISDLYFADIYFSNGDFCSWDSNENDLFGEYNYQARTDNVDLYPDISLGRLNFRDSDQIDGVVNKIITYESTGAYMEDWFKDFTVCGGDTFQDGNSVCEGEYANENAIDIMDGFNPNRIWVTNEKLKFAVNIDSALENGTGFLYFSGHGVNENWVTHPINDFNTWWPLTGYYYFRVELLKNEEKLPVVIIGGCSNCQFTGKNCFGWSFVKNPDGGGIASYGYTGLGWGILGYGFTSGLTGGMELSAIKAYGTYNAKTTGELWTNALNNYLTEFFGWSAYDYKLVEEFQPFNDPSMRIRKVSDFPTIPDKPDGPTAGGVGLEYTYNTMSTDPNGDNIKYCFDWGDGSIGWSDWFSSGETASLSHKWESPGTYEVKIKARDNFGLDSDWSDSLTVEIISEAPFFDILNVKGGIGSVSATIKNIGMLEAYDVNCNISVTGGLLKLIDKFSEDTYDTLDIDEEVAVSVDGIFGLGKIKVIISANSPSANTTTESVQGFVLGPIVILQK